MNDPLASSSGPDAPAGPAAEAATLQVSADGRVIAASDLAVSWWRVPNAEALRGRPFAELFFFQAPPGPGDPQVEAWRLLEAAATVRPLTLQARVDGGGFEVLVALEPAIPDDPETGCLARVTRERRDGRPQDGVTADQLHLKSPPPVVSPAMPVPAAGPEPALDDAGFSAGPGDDEDPLSESASESGTEMETEDAGEEDEELLDGFDGFAAGDESEPVPAAQDEADAAAMTVPLSPQDDWAAWNESNVGFFDLDYSRGAARYSAAWSRLLGYEPGDVADELDTLGALIHPDDSEAVPGAEQRGRSGASLPFTAEIRLRARDGGWRWMQLEGVQRFDASGRIARLHGLMLDVSERHELEEEMGRAEEHLRHLLGPGRYGFFALDLADDTGFFSPALRHMLGYPCAEPPATPDGFLRLLAPEDAQPGLEAFFNAIDESGASLTRRMRLRHADGRDLDFDVVLALQRNRRQGITGVTGLVARASAAAEEAGTSRSANVTAAAGGTPVSDSLAEAARAALDAVGEAVVLTDATGCITHVNLRALHWAGGEADHVVGHPVQEVFPLVDRANNLPVPDVVRRVLEGGSPLELDHRYALPEADGARAHLVITCRALHDIRKRVAGGIVILRKPAEMPLSPAELVASNRMETLGRLACGIAHDFNNILTTVTGAVSLTLDQRKFEALHPAQKALETARHLARQLLTFARGDSAEKRVQSINDIICETARLTGAGSRSAVELQLGGDVFPVNVDSVRIVQVFTNLILNAMQVMPEGGRIWVRSQNMRLGAVNSVALSAGDYVRVEVQDNGPGIPAENLEHIFEPFFSMRSGGTGLGLAMVRSIIAQHEGAVEVASTVGSGTTFTLYFPRATQAPVKENNKPMAITHGTGRVLVMDDDADLCMIAKGMLEVLGYEAETATTAEATIAAVRKYRDMGRRYSAVILDLTMAGGPGGEDVLPRLREIDPEIVAIVSSGYATEDQIQRYQNLGFKGMLAKPYRSGDLGRALKEVLGTGR